MIEELKVRILESRLDAINQAAFDALMRHPDLPDDITAGLKYILEESNFRSSPILTRKASPEIQELVESIRKGNGLDLTKLV